MVVHSLKHGHAGSALRTTGEPRRGRCKKRTGAVDAKPSVARHPAFRGHASATSFGPAPHRFAPRAALLSPSRSSMRRPFSFASGSGTVSSSARPSSAHAPGRSSAVFLSVPVVHSAVVISMNVSATARGAAGDSPVGPTHALRRPLTCHRVRFSTVARAHNQRLQRTSLRSPLNRIR